MVKKEESWRNRFENNFSFPRLSSLWISITQIGDEMQMPKMKYFDFANFGMLNF